MHATESGSDRDRDESNRWAQLAQILATMPDVVQRLTFEHVPDENNRCRGCTLPGTGRPNEPWPCSLRKLAEQARRLHTDQPDQT
jgi:hypothetical protein